MRANWIFAAMLVSSPVLGQAPPRIPLVKGLVEVAAVQRPVGDEEQVMTVTDATPESVEFTVSFRFPNQKPPVSFTRSRKVRRVDLAKSNRRNMVFQEGDAAMFPGSTMAQLSGATLAELKSTGKAAMILGTVPKLGETAQGSGFLEVPSGRKYFRGTLQRVEPRPVPLMVVVNGKQARLPTIHARGTFTVGADSEEIEVWVLDDGDNPLVLRARQGRSVGQTVRLDYPVAQPKADVLAKSLSAGACRAELSGIYFDFAQATLLPQSTPALRAVADTMKANPSWSLRVEGHTDNVGAAAYNQALSQRRAAAVREALVVQFKVAPTRLAAGGFGASRPVAPNTSLEGRAANRRVELARTCP